MSCPFASNFSLTNTQFDAEELKQRCVIESSPHKSGLYKRDRFIHKIGNVAHGIAVSADKTETRQLIVRYGLAAPSNVTTMAGFGIRVVDDVSFKKDLVLLGLDYLSTTSYSNLTPKLVGKYDNNINNQIVTGQAIVFSAFGKDPSIVSAEEWGVEPFKKVSLTMDVDIGKSMLDVIKEGISTKWNLKDNDGNLLYTLELNAFGPDNPDLLFNHIFIDKTQPFLTHWSYGTYVYALYCIFKETISKYMK